MLGTEETISASLCLRTEWLPFRIACLHGGWTVDGHCAAPIRLMMKQTSMRTSFYHIGYIASRTIVHLQKAHEQSKTIQT
jgi:hypothetical protein